MKDIIINSPYLEPTRHFKSDNRGVTDEILDIRRPSSTYVPVPRAHRQEAQQDRLFAEGAYGEEMARDNEFINHVRGVVGQWRKEEYPGITKTTRDLLEYWKDPDRDNKLFFCQIEALETLIFLNEVAEKQGETWIANELRKANAEGSNLYRIAFKMATGSGKTVVMAMIITYHALNKARYPQDTRFTDGFLIITPGITIRDRLNVLYPNDRNNYYLMRDVVSHENFELLQSAVVFITNFHQMGLRENPRLKLSAAHRQAELVEEQAATESPSAMVNRAFKSLLNKPRVLVLNDEAHHCYREKQIDQDLTGEDRLEADENNEAARVWINGLEALASKIHINAVIDLSATPYFLRGSGHPEGELFPWTVFDFSLLDALECGIVKIPRLPVASDTIRIEDVPEFRNLWDYVKDELPKKGKKTGDYDFTTIHLPTKLQEALESLYGNYEEKHWKPYLEAKKHNASVMPPVMIVVCNNTAVSEMVYRWIAGYEYPTGTNQLRLEPGNLGVFRNEDGIRFFERPNTLLIDSAQLESGEPLKDDFKEVFAGEIEDFRKDYRKRYGGRDEPTDEDLLREVMNTVGRPGKLGENIKCVVSVSMLTEGWDTQTVTHILGIRAFTTQLLCEQVVGRALRRVDYEPVADDTGLAMFKPEYAEVYGVPFNFLRAEGGATVQEPKEMHRVHALDSRQQYEITFPRVEGYRYELNEEKLGAHFTQESVTVIENEPTEVTLEGAIGDETRESLERIKTRREGEVIQMLVRSLVKRYYVDGDGQEKYWLTPQLQRIVKEYVHGYVRLKDRMVIGYLSVGAYFSGALTKIQQGIVLENLEHQESRRLFPILAAYDYLGSTRYVDFATTKPVCETVKSHINYVVADTEEWEQGVAKRLEQMDEVLAYAKNHNLGFSIPYEHQGISRNYIPDFLVLLVRPDGTKLNLLIEVTGKKDDKKVVKVKTAREMWVPAVNNHGKFGEWAFLEIQDIHETQNLIRLGLQRGFDNLRPLELFDDAGAANA